MKRNSDTVQIGSVVFLLGSFLLCRYVFFSIHGMKEWPVILFVVGCLCLGYSILTGKNRLSLSSAIGYPISFLVGILFQSDGMDAGGGTTNNLWLIWTVSYVVVIVFGFALELRKSRKVR